MLKIMGLAALVNILTIGIGVYLIYKGVPADQEKLKKFLRVNLFTFVPAVLFAMIMVVPDIASAATASASSDAGMAFIAAALSTGMAAIGGGYAVAVVGSAALGAVSENEQILGKTILYVGLAEGIAIYGLIVSIMILGKI